MLMLGFGTVEGILDKYNELFFTQMDKVMDMLKFSLGSKGNIPENLLDANCIDNDLSIADMSSDLSLNLADDNLISTNIISDLTLIS
jgi:hypothetical protein